MHIKYSDISGFQNLFLDYIEDFEKVENYFSKDFRAIELLPEIKLNKKSTEHREKIVQILKDQYKNYNTGKHTQLNIEALKNENTFAVVTGQQLGLFGGPLYTFYKIITAIKLSAYLKMKFEDFEFVPVFWLEGDDHDFEEVRSFKVINDRNEVEEIKYDDGLESDANRGNVAGIKFNENLNQIFDHLQNELRDTEFKNDLMNLLRNSYGEGKIFESSFKSLLINLFDEYGIIFFEPGDKKIKHILKPVFEQELDDFRNHTQHVIERSAALEEKYHAQVKVKPVNLFLTDEDGRFSIEPAEDSFRLKGKRKKLSREEIQNILEEQPERFSPNVLLRPICQDYLFPTAFYIAGPSEVSYFAQVTPLYKDFNIEPPFIYPRSSATIVEKNISGVIEKYNLDYKNIFSNSDQLVPNVVNQVSEFDVEKMFDGLSTQIDNLLDSVTEDLESLDQNLSGVAEKTKSRIEHSLDGLKDKTEKAQQKKHDVAVRQINKVLALLLPNGNLQEREINFIYFANKYGVDFVKWLYNELKINKFEHQILEL